MMLIQVTKLIKPIKFTKPIEQKTRCKNIGMQSCKNLLGLAKSEQGSATLEFILLGIPVFVPIALYLVAIGGNSSINFEARNFSRQIARAYITGTDQNNAEMRVDTVVEEFRNDIFSQQSVDVSPAVSISCSRNPCLTPGGKVEATVSLSKTGVGVIARASTVETVDQWRSQ